jgi:hypothetical protein
VPRPKGTIARGYGATHRTTRRALLPTAYGSPCTRCGRLILVGDAIDLDHTDDRTAYLGFAHATCNRSAGATLGNRVRALTRRLRQATYQSRQW